MDSSQPPVIPTHPIAPPEVELNGASVPTTHGWLRRWVIRARTLRVAGATLSIAGIFAFGIATAAALADVGCEFDQARQFNECENVVTETDITGTTVTTPTETTPTETTPTETTPTQTTPAVTTPVETVPEPPAPPADPGMPPAEDPVNAEDLGSRDEGSPVAVAGASAPPTAVAAATSHPATLPHTGLEQRLLALLGVALIGLGGAMHLVGRQAAAERR